MASGSVSTSLLRKRWRSTSDSIAQIAETCGYMSESSFSKAFKKQFDTGPGAVRQGASQLH
jgi:transcriptional regulator GlxA family with amidase domain